MLLSEANRIVREKTTNDAVPLRPRVLHILPDGLVIPANCHDLLVTTEHESAAMESGATDVFRPRLDSSVPARYCPMNKHG
jgi:hypothetical protein